MRIDLRSQFPANLCARCRNAVRPKAVPEFQLDAVGRLLIWAAEIAQMQQDFGYEEKAYGGNMHPVRALYIASGGRKGDVFHTAVRRLFDACGMDFLDHDQIENVCDLIAAAFWKTTAGRRKRMAA